ncbi:DUF7266 family protein [Haloglomus halophilum]|jgi:hypothetical protein|uniref:DUF7266 family protein n=1 Tax=Haloglomus halophilum TaxID=2962672 RepID=UPI0020C9B6C5|nr:hypothetical protein [Haloglomus halophilum]
MREFDDRAVSTTVGYTLSLGISALLISGLLIAGGGFLQDQRVTSTRSELTVIGHQIAADIASADRLVGTDASNIRVQRNLPDRVTGSAYTVEVVTSGETHLLLTSAEPEVTVRVDVQTQFISNGLEATSVDGGDIQVAFEENDPADDTDNTLVVSNV